ncbi:MAG: GntP family permease, partial [Actinomycetia bacterium]|nr:GntP family permease [Actinomycetes bacterium]
MEALHTAIAIVGIIALIIVLKVDPVISLVLGSIYLGLAAGLGFEDTISTIATGFGDIMAEVGLLIGFGVLMGSLMFAMGALQRLVELLLRVLGARRLPYAMSAVMTTLFPSIYVDVQLVLASPLARSAAPELGRNGLGMMGGALTSGILVGYVFVVPGLGTVSIAGLLGVPLGTMLLYGIPIGLITAVLTTFIYGRLLRLGFWNPDKDEHASEALIEEEALAAERASNEQDGERARQLPLAIALLPILVSLVMIATAAIADAAGVDSELLRFIGNPVLALFVGLLGAYILAKISIGGEHTDEALTKGLNTTGQILLITGVGGSLGAVIGATGLEDVLRDLFSAESGTSVVVSILLAWFVAALLHLAIGSISVAAIVAAGILAPVMGELDVPAAIIGLAIGAGA